jgi:hypothetical protein
LQQVVAGSSSVTTSHGGYMPESVFASILPKLPCLLSRKDIGKYFGSLISIGYLANLDSHNRGPQKCRIGRKVIYRKEDFIAWLESRLAPENHE